MPVNKWVKENCVFSQSCVACVCTSKCKQSVFDVPFTFVHNSWHWENGLKRRWLPGACSRITGPSFCGFCGDETDKSASLKCKEKWYQWLAAVLRRSQEFFFFFFGLFFSRRFIITHLLFPPLPPKPPQLLFYLPPRHQSPSNSLQLEALEGRASLFV